MKSIFKNLTLLIALFATSFLSAQTENITVVSLSQTAGQYETTSLSLAPGKYIFEITNQNVDKDLGFYLVNADAKQVNNSGVSHLVAKGKTARTGIVELTEGTYKYNCPLNPTPQYTLTVSEKSMVKQEKMMKGQ